MEGIYIWNIFRKKSILPATQDLNKYNLIKDTKVQLLLLRVQYNPALFSKESFMQTGASIYSS